MKTIDKNIVDEAERRFDQGEAITLLERSFVLSRKIKSIQKQLDNLRAIVLSVAEKSDVVEQDEDEIPGA